MEFGKGSNHFLGLIVLFTDKVVRGHNHELESHLI